MFGKKCRSNGKEDLLQDRRGEVSYGGVESAEERWTWWVVAAY